MDTFIDLCESRLRELALADNEPTGEAYGGLSVVMDILHKLLFRIKNRFSKTKEELKVSELNVFWNSHKYTLQADLKKNFLPLPNVLLPVPMGMQVSYYTMMTEVATLIQSTPISIPTQRLQQVLNSAQRLLSSDDKTARHEIAAFYHDTGKLLTDRVDEVDNTIRILLNPKNPQMVKPCTDLFKDRAEVLACIEKGIGFETLFRNALKSQEEWVKLIEQCDTLVNDIMTKPNHFMKDDLLYLGTALSRSARYYEFYGMLLNLLLRTEHLFVDALKVLLKKM